MVFYPTVVCNNLKERHIVKDKNHCECGIQYKVFFTFTHKDLKKIQFKPLQEIDCPKCRSVIS